MKTWITPQLVVLTAAEPQEAVLQVCKTGSVFGGALPAGPESSFLLCVYMPATGGVCSACSTVSMS